MVLTYLFPIDMETHSSEMEQRPTLSKEIAIKDLRDFYWYKQELVDFCRTEGLDKRGGKIELAQRIEKYISTGKRDEYISKSPSSSSKFDWNNGELTNETIITDNYKNSENVREFFKEQIGNRFKFNVKFMNWMKTAQGKTLGDAVEKWLNVIEGNKKNNLPKEIEPQFEYNTYIRDFLSDNPTLDRSKAIACWKIRKLMRGDNKYGKTDLSLIE